MSVLTRIKNNQITDSTILANTKIVPGSIVGSLFNANLTMTSDVTITGNLTVQGSSTYLTVASTNTYVNDPLIVMNNAFTGTNTNDIGLLFNRGSDTNQAIIWDESEDEFRLIATSETGDTYGAVTTSGYANVRVGNLNVEGAAAFGSLSTTGDIGAGNLTLSGDAAVNGGDLTTTATTFNLVNSNATTVNFAGDATTLIVGSTTGTANIRNATINLLGNATVSGTLDVTGHVTLEGVTSVGATGTGNLVFSDSPVLTTPNIGTPSFANLTNATALPISTGVSGLAAGVADFLVTPNSSNLISAVTDETGTGNLVFSTSPVLTTPNIGTPSFANLTNAVALPVSSLVGFASGIADFLTTPTSSNLISAVTDETGTGNLVFSTSPTLETSVVTTSTNFDLLNTTATTVNFAGAATALTIGATSGTANIRNATTGIVGNAVIYSTTPATYSYEGALQVKGGTGIGGNLVVDGLMSIGGGGAGYAGDPDAALTVYAARARTIIQSTSNQWASTFYRVNGVPGGFDIGLNDSAGSSYGGANNAFIAASAGADLVLVATNNSVISEFAIRSSGNIEFNSAYPTSNVSFTIYNTTQSTSTNTGALVVAGGAGIAGNLTAGNLVAGNATITGTLGVTGDSTLTGDLAVNGGDLTTTATTFNLVDATATTVNFAGAATAIDLGATTGTLTINNPTVVGTQTTQNLYNTTATTLNIGGAATALNLGAATGNTTVQNNLITTGNINLDATTPSTDTDSGALIVAGGAGIGGNLFVGGNATIAGNLTVTGNITFTNENNLAITDAIIELHYPEGGVFTENDGHDVGLRFHWYDGSNDNSFLGRANDTGYLEWYGTGVTEDPNVAVISGQYGTMKLGNILLAGNGVVTSTSTSTGAIILENERGIGVGGNIWFGGSTLGAGASTVDLINTTATTVNFAGAATALAIGATTGTLTVNNPTVVGSQTTQDLYNTTATTVNFAGAATTLSIGASSGNTSINNTLDIANTVVISSTGIELANTKITNLQGPTAGADAANKTYVDTALDTFVGTANITLVGTLPNLTVGNLNATSIVSTGNADLGNLSADRINNTVIGDVTPAAATFTNVTDQSLTATRVTFAGTGGDLTDDANFTFASNILTVKNFSINGDTAEISVIGGSGNVVLNPDSGGVIDATGSLVSNIADPQSAQDAVSLSYLQTQINSGVTTLISDDTDFTITDDGVLPGLITANVDTISVAVMSANTINFYNGLMTVDNDTTNVAITGTAYISSIATVNGNLNVNGITTLNNTVNVTSVTDSTAYNNGALTTSGGLGVAGNVSIKLGQQLTIGIEDPQANISFPERQIIALANINSAAGMQLRNVSSGNVASTNYIAVADNNIGETRVATFGIANSNFDIPGSTIKANDGYMFVNGDATGGNLHVDVNSIDKSIYFSVGGYTTEKQVAEISSNTVSVLKDTISTSSSTGALVVAGGVGLGANLNVSGGATINVDQTAESFQVKGQYATTLIYTDSVTDTVTIGGSNTTPISGATLRVNGTGAIVLPVGTTSQRPGSSGNVDVAGMMRVNSSLNILEYYDGSNWQSSQGSFTVISNESFNGDGANVAFEMTGAGSTASTIVAINGIVQIPITSYSVSDTTLTFTEPPESGDIIDVRRLTTTVSVDELSFNQNVFKANLEYALISTGTVAPIPRLLIDTNGLVTVTSDMEIYGNLTVKGSTNGQINIGDSDTDNVAITAEINSNLVPNANNTYDLGSPTQRWKNVYSHATVHNQTPVNVSANATPVLIDSFSTSTYSSAKYLVQVKKANETQIAEILLVQDTANAFITTYGVLSSNVELGGFTANVSSGNVNVYYTSTTATNSNVKVHSTYIV